MVFLNLPGSAGIILSLSHEGFLPNTFEFIVHPPTYQQLYNPDTESIIE
jgi:hypothetical protein